MPQFTTAYGAKLGLVARFSEASMPRQCAYLLHGDLVEKEVRAVQHGHPGVAVVVTAKGRPALHILDEVVGLFATALIRNGKDTLDQLMCF